MSEQNLSYKETLGVIENLPMTWIPAILQLLVKTAIDRKVFQEGQIAPMVARIEEAHKDL